MRMKDMAGMRVPYRAGRTTCVAEAAGTSARGRRVTARLDGQSESDTVPQPGLRAHRRNVAMPSHRRAQRGKRTVNDFRCRFWGNEIRRADSRGVWPVSTDDLSTPLGQGKVRTPPQRH